VPLRIRFATSWPMPTKSWTSDVVRLRTSTGHTSAEYEVIVRKAPRGRPLMSCRGKQESIKFGMGHDLPCPL
jgi:hypothetical protein